MSLDYEELSVTVVVLLMMLFCVVVLIYLIIFITRVGIAAYHKSDRYKLKENERRFHFKDEYHATLNHDMIADELSKE